MLSFYADVFHKGDRDDAREDLDSIHNQIRLKDATLIAGFLGAIIIMTCWLAFYIWCPSTDGKNHWNELYSGMETYFFCFIIFFVVFSAAVNVQVFRAYRVNYAFIFEIDQNYTLIHH